MRDKRMFSQIITDSDNFLDMPASAQALYFHLAMHADDDGFLNCLKRIQRNVCASDDDVKLLIAKQFIIPFESGIIVIKHWRIHNYIQKDRYKPTVFTQELNSLSVSESKEYIPISSCSLPSCDTLGTECIQDVSNLDAQYNIIKENINKTNINISSSSDDGRADFQAIIDSFNQICKSLPKVIKLTDKRKKLISARLADLGNDVSELIKIFEAVERSDFLTGRSGNNWKCSFDWIMTSGNFVKIQEGNYLNRNNDTASSHNDYTDASRYVGLTMNV